MAIRPNPTDFPAAGILWRRWSAATAAELVHGSRPILLFVADPDPTVAVFLQAIFEAMPVNQRLRELLNKEFPALYVEARSIPEALKLLGCCAGARHNELFTLRPNCSYAFFNGQADFLGLELPKHDVLPKAPSAQVAVPVPSAGTISIKKSMLFSNVGRCPARQHSPTPKWVGPLAGRDCDND
jgi:hypothetical protein